ncbi:MAG: lipoyl(octanoyl) transferase LipB [Planctomycetota bacterium]|nr:lipoyl(octanoyl) transferase LipB [Planctomycetota bacterium]
MSSNSSLATTLPAVTVQHLGAVPFTTAHRQMLQLQRELGEARSDRRESLLLFDPSPVVTLGSKSDVDALLMSKSTLVERGLEIEVVDRGGEATYHGPGQILAYPVLRLPESMRDLHRLLRGLETAVIETLARWDINARCDPQHTGVWVEDRKIASIGLSVRRWITGHGLALCYCGDLTPFQWIIPCGIRSCPITSIENELKTLPQREEVEAVLADRLLDFFDRKADK